MQARSISIPLKKSAEVDLLKPLSTFIMAMYPAGQEQVDLLHAVEELNRLRKNALGRPLDKHESCLEILLRYYDQLCTIESKFPFSGNQLCVTFTWKDAFDKGSLFGGSVKLALASLGYEKTCVLFNAAALASQIASEQNLDSDERMKAANKYYQLASGLFCHIKDTVLSVLNREPTVDIAPETVGTFSSIMLAQAQEVVFLKATADKMKDASIAKLANQAADFYGDAFKQCQYKEHLPKEILSLLAAKHRIMQANAELHQSILAKQKKRFGEEIARLQHADKLVKAVASRYHDYVSVKDLNDRINRALTSALKDNDFIYHDRVPEVKDLESIGMAPLVKPTAITLPLSQRFTDMFEKMVPVAVHQSMSMYGQRKAETVNRLVGTMREATNLCHSVLAYLNLPAALEDLSGDSIPHSIVEKARATVKQGGLQRINQLIKDLPELLSCNRDILDESLKMLDEEETSDSELRTKLGQRWNRTPSGDLYKALRAEAANFRSMLDKATHADHRVRERYNTHYDMIALLCKPENELITAIPSANPTKTLQGSEVVNVLRALILQLEELCKERDVLEGEIKAVAIDMSPKFLAALAQDGAIDEEKLSLAQLDQLYGPYSQKIQAGRRTQDFLLGEVQKSHQEFSGLKPSNTEASAREEVLKKLASAHDSFMEIINTLHEGTKFYSSFTEILLRFQNTCSDIVFARKTERDDLLNELQQSIARQPSSLSGVNAPASILDPPTATTTTMSSAAVPQQQSQPKGGQPPARPPPPPPPSVVATTAAPAALRNLPPSAPLMANTPLGLPYPTYYQGYYQMPMGYNPYAYGQYNMPYQAAPPTQASYPQQPGPKQQHYYHPHR